MQVPNEVVVKSFPRVVLDLPGWVETFLGDPGRTYPTGEDRMRLVIELSRLNVGQGIGETFGAGVFDLETNRLITPGVNLVTTANLSAAHAEIVAIMVAQQVVRLFDLGGPGHPPYELVASTEPCAQCFGSVPWPGVRRLVCGARDEDARGIPVLRDVCREEAAAVLRNYAEAEGRSATPVRATDRREGGVR